MTLKSQCARNEPDRLNNSNVRLELLFEYGPNSWTGFKAQGVICRVSFSPQQLLEAVENGGNGEIAFESDDFVVEGKKYN
jgi:hypothetical protein